MFQNTLLIIKADYMRKRKTLLKYLLTRGFQIQGQRSLSFSVEEAAEFYGDLEDNSYFMVQVMLLSKGNSEAYILTKTNAVEDMLNILICYFGSSIEMDRYIHVTTCYLKVGREISYIFPNYIHEPIYPLEQLKFCTKTHIIKPMMSELYDIVTQKDDKDANKSWKTKLAEALELSHAGLPQISNLYNYSPSPHMLAKAIQTKATSFKPVKLHRGMDGGSSATLKSHVLSCTTQGTLDLSSSSCISCSSFQSIDTCMRQSYRKLPLSDLVKAKTAPLDLSVSEEEIDKIKVAEKEKVGMAEEVLKMDFEEESKFLGESEYLEVKDISSIEICSAAEVAVEEPSAGEFIAEEPAAVEPAAAEPATVEPPFEEPTAEEMPTLQSVTEEPAIGQTTAVETVTEGPAGVEKPTAVELVAEEPAKETVVIEPTTAEPAAEELAPDEKEMPEQLTAQEPVEQPPAE
uniref:NDK domain-containing protein n=1 Tax=Glossina brevipalpis TaxID=37001 RepID=A0A1A9WJR8_9MUSC